MTSTASVPVPENISPFLTYLSFLPVGYQFTKDEIVAMWLAEGLIQEENESDDAFSWLFSNDVIVHSKIEHINDYLNPYIRRNFYKLNQSPQKQQAESASATLSTTDMANFNLPESLLHLSLHLEFQTCDFVALKRFKRLRTLFFIPRPFHLPLPPIPSSLFESLTNLRSLNLSRNGLSELPSSIMFLKYLQYLDLSYNLFQYLPDSIVYLAELQSLKLRGCSNLQCLPKKMRMLTNLRHLDLDVIGLLKSMPSGMGNLTKIRTLSAFLVGSSAEGCGIEELRNMNNITGSFYIMKIENVTDPEKAKDANLVDKRFVKSLELRWKDTRVANNSEEILEQLQPPLELEWLRLYHYCGSKLPSWIHSPSYVVLSDIVLSGCTKCQLLPSLGELPSLKSLNIDKMNELEKIDHPQLCRKGLLHCLPPLFPKLEKLSIHSMPKLVEWTGVQQGDFPLLQRLRVVQCPKLVSLPFQSRLPSLKNLELSYCPSIMLFPNKNVIPFLKSLFVMGCPELKQRLQKENGPDWGKIAHVPCMLIK